MPPFERYTKYFIGSKASEESNAESDEIIKADKIHDEPDLLVEGPQVDIVTTPDSSAETDSAPETAAEVVKSIPPSPKKKKVEPEPEPETTTRKSSRVSQRVSKRVQEKVQPAKKETLKKKAAPPSTRAGSTRRSTTTRKGKA